MPQIFVSYSRKDLTFIERLAADLKKYDFDVWYDISRLDGGARWNRAIEQAIKDSQYAIVVLSPDSVISEYVEDEVVFARKLKKKVVPLYYRPCDLGMIWINLHYIDVQGGNYGSNFERILRALDVSNAVLSVNSKKTAEPTPKQKEKPVEVKKATIEKPKPISVPQISTNQKYTENGFLIETLGGIDFVQVPAGKFLMGSTKENRFAYLDERLQHSVDLPYNYWMARSPITNELYNIYAKAKGIKHPVEGWEKKREHPVVYISWRDAMDYCKWLNNLLKAELPSRLELRLPSEAEWEKAARGTDGREYSWGNKFDKNKCNTREGGKGETTVVGLYSPQGDSPYGCVDMSGNIWELTHSLKKEYPYKVDDGREDEKVFGARVLRGGSFFTSWKSARCAYRLVDKISFDKLIGFRVVISPILF